MPALWRNGLINILMMCTRDQRRTLSDYVMTSHLRLDYRLDCSTVVNEQRDVETLP